MGKTNFSHFGVLYKKIKPNWIPNFLFGICSLKWNKIIVKNSRFSGLWFFENQSFVKRAARENESFQQNHFSLFIRGPGGLDSWENKNSKQSRDTATLKSTLRWGFTHKKWTLKSTFLCFNYSSYSIFWCRFFFVKCLGYKTYLL